MQKTHKKQKRICVITGSRAEYGLLYWLMKAMEEDPDIDFKLIVTGAHLSPEFGLTVREIENDGFVIDSKVEMLLSSDTDAGITKSTGLGLIGFADAYKQIEPDMIVVLGDRYEILPPVIAALFFKIPVAHMYGGERTEGLIDEGIRHTVTKMSHIHLAATHEYHKRVIQLGEQPGNVFTVGSIGLENIRKLELLSKEDLEKSLDFEFGTRNLLVTFHPVTLEKNTSREQFENILKVLDQQPDTKIIFTKANADNNGRIINTMIDAYAMAHPEKAKAFTTMGVERYLSTLQYVDAVVGNSSSGIIEVPSFHIGTVNIGDRQKGRLKPKSVIDCEPDQESIRCAIKRVYEKDFQGMIADLVNPYGDGKTSRTIIEILKNINLNELIKKEFFDIDFDV